MTFLNFIPISFSLGFSYFLLLSQFLNRSTGKTFNGHLETSTILNYRNLDQKLLQDSDSLRYRPDVRGIGRKDVKFASSLAQPEADQLEIVIRDSTLEQSQPSRVILYIIITGHSVFPSELLFEFFACFLWTDKNTIWKSKMNRIPIYNCPVGLNDWTKQKKKSNLLLIEEVDPDTLFFANSCLLMCENYSVTE